MSDSVSYKSEIDKFKSNNLMASIDVESLFSKIFLGETIGFIINYIFLRTANVANSTKEKLK